jgi:glyoxylase-like metal-dependent hydrolase (beta-lactamase superfamily II)
LLTAGRRLGDYGLPVIGGIHRLESELWQTTSLLLVDGREAVAVDPGVTPAEIDRVRGTADGLGVRIGSILATHSHFDHVCGSAASSPPTRTSTTSAASARSRTQRP